MGIIYKIQVNNFIYYGSTSQQLCKRQASHNYKLRNNYKQKLYQECINQNINNIKCELVEVCDNSILKERENFYILNCNNSLNLRHSKSSLERMKETNKRYQQSDKGKLAKKKADAKYQQKNKELLKLKRKLKNQIN